MRYQRADGGSSFKFVRPAHQLVALWGEQVIDIQALGLKSGRKTLGHRFMSTQDIELTDSNTYEQQLLDEGRVIASFTDRRTLISEQLLEQAQALGATIGTGSEVDALLDEVTALVDRKRGVWGKSVS